MSPRVRRLLLALPALGVAILTSPSAFADTVVAEIARDTPIAAYGGAVAWSAYDAASGRYALVIRRGATVAPAPIATAAEVFDVSLGPDARGRVVALYTRCRTASTLTQPARGCDVYRYALRERREHRLTAVSSPSHDESWPVQWRDRVAFTRGVPSAKRGPTTACRVPFVKTLASSRPSRRLDRGGVCSDTVGMAIRGTTIVQVTSTRVRLLSALGGIGRRLAYAARGEGGYSPFVSPNLSASALWLTRTGERDTGQPEDRRGFVRIDLRSGRLTAVRANLNLAGRVARDERGAFWYVQAPEPLTDDDTGAPPFCVSDIDPCRLVRASPSPFSGTRRVLPARLFGPGPAGRSYLGVLATDPVLTGELARTIVRGDAIVGRRPLAGVGLEVRLRAGSILEQAPLTAPGITTTTDAEGRWSLTLPQPPPVSVASVVAPGLRIASRLVEIQATSRIAQSASGRSLSGTVAPAQPGRSINIQRHDREWVTVATVPLVAGGTAFSLVADRPGGYRAELHYTPAVGPLSYGGQSDEVTVSP